MGDKLIRGGVESSKFAGSMGAAIEDALNNLLSNPLPDNDEPETHDRRRLFVAIAQGVIDHLAANPDAFRLDLVKNGPAITGVKLSSIEKG